jgi:anti-sigma B factor antagonist
MSETTYNLIEEDGVVILSVGGNLSSPSVQYFDLQLEESMKISNKLILNFSELEYICSAAIGELISYFNQAEQIGGSVVVCGINKKMKKVLDIIGFPSVMQTTTSVGKAKKLLAKK